MTKFIMLFFCVGLLGSSVIADVQAEAFNQGQITYADDHGISTSTDNHNGVIIMPDGTVKVMPVCGGRIPC